MGLSNECVEKGFEGEPVVFGWGPEYTSPLSSP